MLEPLGITPEQELVYRALLRGDADLAASTGLPEGQVNQALTALVEQGFASDERTPLPPDLVIEPLVLRHQHEVRRAVGEIAELHRSWSARPPSWRNDLIEVVSGRDTVQERSAQLHAMARVEVISLARLPYLVPADGLGNDGELSNLGAGVRHRVIYDQQVVDQPGGLRHVQQWVARGEQSRVTSQVPMKFHLCDRALALVPLLDPGDGAPPSAVLIRDSALLAWLIGLFESLWRRATPVPASGSALEEITCLLALVHAGLTEESIARQLGVSAATVRRRIRRLMELTGSSTRFQLGCEAVRRGWL